VGHENNFERIKRLWMLGRKRQKEGTVMYLAHCPQ
jgi:hypothetical protein